MEQERLDIKEIQAIMLDIMKDIDKFCRANNIRYSLSDGTILGAVRHKGFIPWDDDADLHMLREDFNRFVKTYKSDKYHVLYNTRGDTEHLVCGYAKVCDPTTNVAKSKQAMTHYGLFVDIFPLDPVPEDENERKKFMHKVRSTHNRLYHRQKSDLWSIIKAHRHSLDWWWNRLNTIIGQSKRYADSPLVGNLLTAGTTVIPRDWFDNLADTPFEGYNFLAYKEPHSYLARVYGEDYMTPKRWSHNLQVYKEDSE